MIAKRNMDGIDPIEIENQHESPLPEGIKNLGDVESLHLQIHGIFQNCKIN